MNRTSLNYLILAAITFVVSFFYLPNGNAQKNKPISDTTKKPVYKHYILKGSDTMFILLQNLMVSPGDVTPNQKNAVINWFQQNIKIDSTKNK